MQNHPQNTLTRLTKYLLLGLTFSLFFLTALGQQGKIDSLITLLKKDKEDTTKVNHLNALGKELIYSNPDSAILLVTQALNLSEKQNWKKGIANSCIWLGWCEYGKGNYQKALDYDYRALKTGEVIDNKKIISSALGNIGLVYQEQGDYPKALDYYLKALKIAKEMGDKTGIVRCFGSIGNVYLKRGDYPKAVDYYFKALKIGEELGDKNRIAIQLGNIGLVYFNQGDYQKALDYYFKALKIAEELGGKKGIAFQLGNIGSVYTAQKKYAKAEKYLLDGLRLTQEIGVQNEERQFEEALSTLYEKTGKEKLALEHYKKSMVLKDTLFSQENKKQLVRKEMNYEFDKKEAVTNAVHKKELENQEAIADEKSRKQKIVSWSIALGLLFVIVFAGFIVRSLRITRKQKQIIEVQKTEVEKSKHIIEEKNKDITDSINYAKRIQQAKLPRKEIIYSALPDSFVLFKPKDIVSGDFYFFHKNDKSIFIASADCTGHGVPGAFMSMIGSEKLDDALAHSADTSEILRHLNKGIKNSLHQTDSDESTRDGMDIALCSVDTDNCVVKYAGANRPLWIIRNGQTAVEEIKATKKAIGGFTEDSQHFDTHVVQLQHGDTFYIFSDGYADTFGGQEEKKLTTKRFKEILLSIQYKSMQDQEAHLGDFIEDWKAGTEQVDDILVIGVRL